ncbi:hypothetical protein ACFWVC_11300 [Streptomyces sp. NPDC058691]|uniref:hypothetical protein n=1 Tax=Streptomyces sp. NPDC058691 TaxID=3346601 RepID=UPI003659CF94
MSDNTGSPDWQGMKPRDFTTRRPKAPHDGRGLFLVDELDAGGTEAMFGADLWDGDASPAGAAPAATQEVKR